MVLSVSIKGEAARKGVPYIVLFFVFFPQNGSGKPPGAGN